MGPKCVLILGAGASADYGLPIGSELRNWILNEAKAELFRVLEPAHRPVRWRNIHDGSESIEDLEYEMAANQLQIDLDHFVSKFNSYGKSTIDLFLANNPDLAKLGRIAISLRLLKAQEDALLSDLSKGCYDIVRDWLTQSPPESFDNLKIINFNYDQTFELLLPTMLHAQHQKLDADVCCHIVKKNQVHVYGSLDSEFSFKERPFHRFERRSLHPDNHLTRDELYSCADRIGIIERDLNSDIEKNFSIAKKWLAESRAVFFLGFGFDETNMKRLGFGVESQPISDVKCRVYATTFLMRPKATENARKMILQGMPRCELDFGHDQQKCRDYLESLEINPLHDPGTD